MSNGTQARRATSRAPIQGRSASAHSAALESKNARARATLEHFDSLPDSAQVRAAVVCAWKDISTSTLRRMCNEGRLPLPIREGRDRRWVVGDLREALAK